MSLWCSSMFPTRASLSSSFLFLNLPLLRFRHLFGLRSSPFMSSSMILFPLAPKVSEAMEESLMFASSRIFSTRCFSAVIVWISFLLYRVRSRSSRTSFGGMKLPLTRPLRRSLQSHSLSSTSVFLPGTCLTWRALTRITSKVSSEDVEHGLPVDPGALHGDMGYPVLFQPCLETEKIVRHRECRF